MELELLMDCHLDSSAVEPICDLIFSFLETHKFDGCIAICEDEIRFAKYVFFTKGRIKYTPYDIACVDGKVRYTGSERYVCKSKNHPYHQLFVSLYNALLQVKKGYMCKL